MHEARDHATQALHKVCAACGCSDCADVQGRLEGAASFQGADADTDRHQAAEIKRGNTESVLDILNRLQAKGLLSSQQAQMAAAAIAVRPMYGNVKA
jgi:hypothetical protein